MSEPTQPLVDSTAATAGPVDLDLALRIDAACATFEAAWRAGHPLAIGEVLDAHSDLDGTALLRELVALEVELRRDRGDRPEPGDYDGAFPGQAEAIAAAFAPAARRSSASTGRSPRLGPAREVPKAPRRLGGYELFEEIGRGGMGLVFRARQAGLGREVAVKVIRSGGLAGPVERRRFQAEAKAAADLDHPNIVPIYEVGRVRGRPYFSMKLVAGGSLSRHARRIGADFAATARLVAVVARAVDHAHARGFVHRDLKPGNILIDDRDRPYVTDFGLAKRVGSGRGLTQVGMPVGTPGYMAPEQAAGLVEVGPAADVYGLGAILYKLLTGRPPHAGPGPVGALVAALEDEPTPPRRLRPEVPRDLERICQRCLEREPRRRYPSAAALADDLERYLRGELAEAARVGPIAEARRLIRREPEIVARVVGLAAILALTQVNFLIDPRPNPPIHWLAIAIELAWLVASLGFHWLARRGRTRPDRLRAAWIAADVAALTALLWLLGAVESSLVVGYPLLIAASGLWGRARLVGWTTALSLVGYAALAVDAAVAGRALDPNHHPNIVAAAFVVAGFVVAQQVRRFRALRRFVEARPG